MNDAVTKARAVIDEWVRPVVEADGGGIELAEATEQRVVVHLTKLCGGCPGAPYTIERVLRPALESVFGDGLQLEVVRKPRIPGSD